MITTILTIPALLFLAAHAFRMGSLGGAIFWLMAIFLAIAPVPWKSWALAGLMGFGAGLWGDITHTLVQHRIGSGLPWVRLAVILGTVTLLCLAATLMNWRRARRDGSPGSLIQALAFLLTIAGLAIVRQKTLLDILLLDRFLPGGGWIVVILLGWCAAWIAGKMVQSANSAKWQ